MLMDVATAALACPVCGEALAQKERSLVCARRHSFDLARQGYVNFLTKPVKEQYDKALFAARAEIGALGFFDVLIEALTEALTEHMQTTTPVIADAGSGEGTQLFGICQRLAEQGKQPVGIGLDIAKEGVKLAAARYPICGWCVADITHLPLQDASVDAVLSVLSPAHYGEARRVLKPGGVLIKAIPAPDYLGELRALLYEGTAAETYENQRVQEHFAAHFSGLERHEIRRVVRVEAAQLPALLRMTPLAWHASEEAKARVLAKAGLDMTVAFELAVGQKDADCPAMAEVPKHER